MLFTGTLTLGCRSYLDAQKTACYCPSGGGNSGPSAPPPDSRSNNYNNRDKNRKYESGGQNRPDSKSTGKQQQPSYGWKDKKDL